MTELKIARPPVPFEPLNDWVLIEMVPEGFTPGGIAVPEGADVGAKVGKILAIGPGRMSEYGVCIETSLEIGAVVYPPLQGITVTIQGKDYVICREEQLLGRVPKENE